MRADGGCSEKPLLNVLRSDYYIRPFLCTVLYITLTRSKSFSTVCVYQHCLCTILRVRVSISCPEFLEQLCWRDSAWTAASIPVLLLREKVFHGLGLYDAKVNILYWLLACQRVCHSVGHFRLKTTCIEQTQAVIWQQQKQQFWPISFLSLVALLFLHGRHQSFLSRKQLIWLLLSKTVMIMIRCAVSSLQCAVYCHCWWWSGCNGIVYQLDLRLLSCFGDPEVMSDYGDPEVTMQ